MNPAHLHLIFNHVPIVGSFFALVLLGVGLLRRNETLTRAGLVAVLAAAILCIPAQLTGEGAEEVIEDRLNISHHLIHEHEEAAELGFMALELTGALALFGLLLLGRRSPKATLVAGLTLAGAVVSFGLLAQAGNLGGEISHPEVRTVKAE
ncbi:hypothetical protein Q5H93_13595 [Hymenobacter sp. ASUV-10]|uniref:DUF2231 domain-containing protein n=1 Tax=Hymenobacter aranciens TaxID=3063996 RepID=A0ABT9BFG4_9BACT|nr:hypothetical protein [Hymenobacter sp. ASUV-10]MDO7875772.1 hypothetical protein [Hymenobacter sp. ASUV-10]